MKNCSTETLLKIKKLKKIMLPLFASDNSGHNISHVKKVTTLAQRIQKHEGGNWAVITAACLVHDVHRLMQNEKGRYVSPKESLNKIKDFLQSVELENSLISEILDIVKFHEETHLQKNMTLNAKIVYDADALESFGARGLIRTLTYCKKYGIPLNALTIPLDCETYVPNLNPISVCHYIYRSLIPNTKKMNTKHAQFLATKRAKILQKFLKDNLQNSGKLILPRGVIFRW